jgi:hypothetical protein
LGPIGVSFQADERRRDLRRCTQEATSRVRDSPYQASAAFGKLRSQYGSERRVSCKIWRNWRRLPAKFQCGQDGRAVEVRLDGIVMGCRFLRLVDRENPQGRTVWRPLFGVEVDCRHADAARETRRTSPHHGRRCAGQAYNLTEHTGQIDRRFSRRWWSMWESATDEDAI